MPSDAFSASGVKLPIRPKAIAFDLDGTLLDYSGNLTPGVEKAVKLMVASGLKVFLVTGRLQNGCEAYWRRFGLDTPIATCNGARVGFPDAPPFFIRQLSAEARAIIMELERKHDLYVNYYIDSTVYASSDKPEREWYSAHFSPVVRADSAEQIAGMERPMKCLCIVDEKDNAAVTALFAKSLGGLANLTESNKRFIEILPPGADKAEGLRQLMTWAGIPLEQCVAVGDGLNDLLAKVVLGMTDSGRFLTSRSQRFLKK